LRPALRKALSELENGIHDVNAEEICGIIRRELGAKREKYSVRIEPAVWCEATVSAIVRFTWLNQRAGSDKRASLRF